MNLKVTSRLLKNLNKNGEMKRFTDILYLHKKCTYHRNNFNTLICKYKGELKSSLLSDFNNLHGDKFNQDKQVKTMTIIKSTPFFCDDESFFEYDTFMIDVKRIIEYLIKLVAKLMQEKEPEKVTSFFEGLTNTQKNSNFCKRVIKDHPSFHTYLQNEWNYWIKGINYYRTKTIHYEIPNELSGEAVFLWNFNSNIIEPVNSKVNLKMKHTEIVDEIDVTYDRLNKFMNETIIFLNEIPEVTNTVIIN